MSNDLRTLTTKAVMLNLKRRKIGLLSSANSLNPEIVFLLLVYNVRLYVRIVFV